MAEHRRAILPARSARWVSVHALAILALAGCAAAAVGDHERNRLAIAAALSASEDVLEAQREEKQGPLRRLTAAEEYPHFAQDPYVNCLVHDSHDDNCNRNYNSPPITTEGPGYPQDGTDIIRVRNLGCGIAPVRFVFFTSDLPNYTDTSVLANMELRIWTYEATFITTSTCENILDATDGFPRIETCDFMDHEARLVLSTRFLPSARYSITMKVVQPAGTRTSAQNSMDLQVKFYERGTIEGTRAPVDMCHVIPNAKDETAWGDRDYTQRGYITSFTWQPETYTSKADDLTYFHFGLRSFGTMPSGSVSMIDIIAYPTDIWRFGTDGVACDDYSGPGTVNTDCTLISFSGAQYPEANGFRLRILNTPATNMNVQFNLRLPTPSVAVNAQWTATSYELDSNNLVLNPYTVILDKPIAVVGKPTGGIVFPEIAKVSEDMQITLEFSPGNTLVPSQTEAGMLVILPPDGANDLAYEVIASASPTGPGAGYNALPCDSWPEADRTSANPRWTCLLSNNPIFKDTAYRVMLTVRSPATPGAARSWRVELWQTGTTKPVSITRSIRGLPIAGALLASFFPANQLLGGANLLTFEFTPSLDVGSMANTRLEVIAPTGFLIVKRCVGFQGLVLPVATCEGSNANSFRLVFLEPNAITAGNTYTFELEVQNPLVNAALSEQWRFTTVRPDGIARDTDTFAGFFLYPYQFLTFDIFPVSRYTGIQFVIVRFTPGFDIAFDDYLRIRAPDSFGWYAVDLGMTTNKDDTNAVEEFTAKNIAVDPINTNVLSFQLDTPLTARFEYGLRARCIVPLATPVTNRWWIEQYQQTGDPPPNQWRYIASMGAEGFRTQVLESVQIAPSNIVESAWQNPTLVTFLTTEAIVPETQSSSTGITVVPAEIYLEAPPGFTFICPVSATVYMPDGAIDVPESTCIVNHATEAERNKLFLQFNEPLLANTKYAFTIDLVNAPFVLLTQNFYRLETRINGQMVEGVTLQGFRLAQRMDNTRYVEFRKTTPPMFDPRPEATQNEISFTIGTLEAINAATLLEVTAPRGYIFPFDCLDSVGASTWVGADHALPTVLACQNLELEDNRGPNMARLSLAAGWQVGSHGLYVTVTNPAYTPALNVWGFTIYDVTGTEALMSESWVSGFNLGVIRNPSLIFYNQGNSIPGSAAVNIIEISFQVTTRLAPIQEEDLIKYFAVTAPAGFTFRSVCSFFNVRFKEISTGEGQLPVDTQCQGNNGQELLLTMNPLPYAIEPGITYSFRVAVVNPAETYTDTDDLRWMWIFETRQQVVGTTGWELVDRDRLVVSPPVYQRLSYVAVDPTSQVGLDSVTLRIHIRTWDDVPPQQTISIRPPDGTLFGGVGDGECNDEDPAVLSASWDPQPLLSGVARLPEWMQCRVVSPTEVRLTNTEPLLGGRSLTTGPVYEMFLKNTTNAQATPILNFFSVTARTNTPLGQERWFADGYIIYPKILNPQVSSSNPGYGLYTNLTFQMTPVTEVPGGGSMRIIAPSDFYFGPVIVTPENYNDPLESIPPPQGSSPDRPYIDPLSPVKCTVERPTDIWMGCPADFVPCRERVALLEIGCYGSCAANPNTQAAYDLNAATLLNQCNDYINRCNNGDLGPSFEGDSGALFICESLGSHFTVTLAADVILPAFQQVDFIVRGYNAREVESLASPDNTWRFITRNNDAEQTTLDDRPGIAPLHLIGVVYIDQMLPSHTGINVIENRVELVIRLDKEVPAQALMRITHPMSFMRDPNAAFSTQVIEVGENFPRQIQRTVRLNVLEILAVEEPFPAQVPMILTIGLTNPSISPSKMDNLWRFETISIQQPEGIETLQNCNYNVSGFKIFGEFAQAAITGAINSPGQVNIIGVWFSLNSIVPVSDSSTMKIWLPFGFVPLERCGLFSGEFQLSFNPFRVGDYTFPTDIQYFGIPSGVQCFRRQDGSTGQYYIELLIYESLAFLDYGLNYAFEFGVTNGQTTPPAEENVWRFETLVDGVVLHLREEVPGIELEQIQHVEVIPTDATKQNPLHEIIFSIESAEYIPGGSRVVIDAPAGFTFTCRFFRVVGLASTTTCSFDGNRGIFIIDTQDWKPPNTPFSLHVYVINPEFTPQDNYWDFSIFGPLEDPVDTRRGVPGFDITGVVDVTITATFPYLGQLNPLIVVFVPTTIMNQNDNGNQLVISGPQGYIFPTNCTGFELRLTDQDSISSSAQNDGSGFQQYRSFTFPPVGVTCRGYENSTAVIAFPDGKGLLRNNYTILLDVQNPDFAPNDTNNIVNEWSFITRVDQPPAFRRIVDATSGLEGFDLLELVPVRTDENAAPMGCDPRWAAFVAFAACALCLDQMLRLA